jgi:CRISPR system Cascade subunit CasD
MNVLLLRLAAPMQSWGTHSRFTERDTGREPTKSGVLGLVSAALGRGREVPPDDLATLRMGVRVDREGRLMRDYHTTGGGTWLGQPYGVAKADGKPITWANMAKATLPSNRYYLADAVFLAALEGQDGGLLTRIDQALAAPVWPLFLGRKAFPPAEPVCLEGGLLSGETLEAALRNRPYLAAARPARREDPPERLRLVIECRPGEPGEPRQDVPLSFRSDARDFGLRHVREEWVALADLPKEAAPCS